MYLPHQNRPRCSVLVSIYHYSNGSVNNNYHEKIAYILLRLQFGVANSLNDFSLVSEPIIAIKTISYRTHHGTLCIYIHHYGLSLQSHMSVIHPI